VLRDHIFAPLHCSQLGDHRCKRKDNDDVTQVGLTMNGRMCGSIIQTDQLILAADPDASRRKLTYQLEIVHICLRRILGGTDILGPPPGCFHPKERAEVPLDAVLDIPTADTVKGSSFLPEDDVLVCTV